MSGDRIGASLKPFSQEIIVRTTRGPASGGAWVEIVQDHDTVMVSLQQLPEFLSAINRKAKELAEDL